MRPSFVRKPVVPALAFAVLAALVLGPSAARAGDGVGVARISLIHGSVAVQRGDSSSPVAAALNAPVLGADYVTTGDGARAEVQFDSPTMVRLGSNVQMRFTRIDTGVRALQLAQGTIELRLMRGTDGTSDIDTPSVSIRPRAAGIYRVTVTPDGVTNVTVRAGAAQVVTPQGERALETGVTLIAQGDAANPILRTVDAIAYDDFDRFNKDRDDRHERALAASGYTGPSLQGIDDLDSYGRWVNDGSYGNVWVPSNVTPGWAPYRDGRWAWEGGYGWTWVGYEPWGWAPYHYGRWYRSPVYGWCWHPPGELVPVWQPALVGFFTFGGGFGTIGWVPLAPYEPYYPWWRGGYGNPTIVYNNITVINNNNGHDGHNNNGGNGQPGDGLVHRMYTNAPYGATALPGQRFLEGRFEHAAAVPPAKLRHIEIVRGALPVVPTAANLRFSDTPVAPQLAVQPAQTRTFAGNAVVARRVPFEQQREAIAAQAAVRTIAAPHAAAVPQKTLASPWDRFNGARAPVVIDGSTVRSSGGAGKSSDAAPRTTATQPRSSVIVNDPWARFEAQRGTTTTSHASEYSAPARTLQAGGNAMQSTTVPARHDTPAVMPMRHDAPPVAPVRHEAAPVYAQPVVEHRAPPAAPPPPQQRHTEHTERHTTTSPGRPPG
jgi:Family of unknown function (DUF6600)/FecR protein